MKTELKFHNPDNLETAGDPPWRFLLVGENVEDGDEYFSRGQKEWSCSCCEGITVTSVINTAYRTRRPLPAPQPGGGGEAEECKYCGSTLHHSDLCSREVTAPPTPPIALPVRAEATFSNGCERTIPQALRYLAENPRPAGGCENYNSEHLYQLADEMEDAVKKVSGNQWKLDAYANIQKWVEEMGFSAFVEIPPRLAALSRELEKWKSKAGKVHGQIAFVEVERDALRRELEEAKAERDAARHTRDRMAEHQADTERRLSAELTALCAAPRSEGAIESAIQRFEDKERGIPQAHMATELVKELRTALAALSPRSETEGREAVPVLAIGYYPWNEKEQKWDYTTGTDVPSEPEGNLIEGWEWKKVAIVPLAALAHDEKGAGE